MAVYDFTSNYGVILQNLTADFSAGYRTVREFTLDFDSNYFGFVPQTLDFSSNYDVRPEGERVADFTNAYLAYAPVELPQIPPTILVTIRGEPLDFDDITDQLSISINTSGSGYTCSITSASIPRDLTLNDTISIVIGADRYNFLFDRLDIQEDGLEAASVTLSGVSPLLAYGLPRSRAQDFTNNTATLASSIVRQLLGSIDWQIVDWTIPEFRLGVSQQTPLDIARSVIDAAGGILTSDRLGNPVAKYQYPVSTNDYLTATPDQTYNTFDHVFSRRHTLDPKPGYNNFLVTDVSPGTTSAQFNDVLEADVAGRSAAVITAYLSPRRGVRLAHTAPETITVETLQQNQTLVEEEDVEIVNGSGRTRRPIDSIASMDFISTPVTGVRYTRGSNELVTQDPRAFGLVRIRYNTVANQYRVSGVTSPKVQFLLKDD